MDVLEYLVRMRGAAEAAAQMRALAAETRKATGESAGLGRLGGAADLAAKGIGAIGVVAVGVGLEAVKMSTQFNHEMLRIRTDAGASTAELKRMKAGVLDLASSGASMGQGPMSLAQGLYHLESLGIRGSRALDALKLASQESAISGASLEETTTALGAAMYTNIKGTGNLTQLMGTLNATVGAGNMRFQDLVEALGTGVLPSAKVAGLSIQDVSAALAVATDAGYKASSAAAQLGTAFHFLYSPGTKAQAALHSMGMTGTQLAQDMHKPQGLLVALRDLRNHLDHLPGGMKGVAAAQTLNAILPGGRGRILLTELTMLDRLQGKYKQINATAGGFEGSVSAQRQDPQTQLKTAEARIQANMIRLGNMLTPIVVPAITAALNVGSKFLGLLLKLPEAISKVSHLFEGTGHTFDRAGKTIGTALSSIGHTASDLWRLLSSAFSSIADAAHKTFSLSFVKDLATIGSQIVRFGAQFFGIVSTITQAILPGLVDAVKGAFTIIRGVVEVLAGILTLDFGKAWKGVEDIFSGAAKIVVGIFTDLINVGIITPLNFLIQAIDSISIKIPSWVPFVGGNHIGFNIGQIGYLGASSSPSSPVTGTVQTRNPKLNYSTPGHQGTGQIHKAFQGGGDVVIKIGEQTFARVQRRQILNAMASGA